MGRRPIAPTSELQNFVTPPSRRTIRKRKISNGNIAAHAAAAAAHSSGRAAKAVRLNSDAEEEHDEDSSSNDTHALNFSTKHANNSSILLNSSLKLEQSSPANNESPRPVYTLRPSIVNGTILYDLTEKPWRLGNPIGKGNFGEIFLASDNITLPVTNENAKYVVKIEPHSNGPLFVEIHCLMNTAKKDATQEDQQQQQQNDIKIKQEQQTLKEAAAHQQQQQQQQQQQELIAPTKPSGIPDYIASGSHFFGDARYRFLVLKRFDKDLHSLIKNSCVSQKSVLTLAIQIVKVLENLHDKGYCHNDVKSQNLMISKCKYYDNNEPKKTTTATTATTTKTLKKAAKYLEKYEEKQPTTDSGNSSEQEANDYDDDDDYDDEKFVVKRKSKKSYDRDDDYECANDGGGTSDQDNDNDDDEDFDDCTTTSNSNSMDIYKTPIMKGGRRGRRAAIVQYSGSNPVRSCRRPQRPNSIYEEMVNSHYLRPSNKRISYSEFFDEDGVSVKGGSANNGGGSGGGGGGNDSDFDIRQFGGKNALLDNSRAYERNLRHQSNSTEDDDSNEFMPNSLRRRRVAGAAAAGAVTNSASAKRKSAKTNRLNNKAKTKNSPPKRLTRRQEKLLIEKQQEQQHQHQPQQQIQQQPRVLVEAEHIFLIDFGLASKYIDRGVHRPFIMDQRRAHDGTLEFTSRDAHMGAHSRRSDLECLGYNLLYWSQGFLPWKDAAAHQQQEKVHRAKEYLMTDVREMLKLIYGKDVPKYLGEFLHLVGQLTYHERPHYARYRRLFENEYRQLGYSLSEMRLDSQEIARDCIRIRKDHGGVDKHDFFEQNNKLISNNDILSIMKIGGAGCHGIGCGSVGTPFLQERNSIGDRVSPKNLRSKSSKKTARKKKFNWAEVLSQDPDQIARERAEKEFDRELNDENERPVRRYEGNPTYAILELLKKNEDEVKYELAVDNDDDEEEEEEEEVDDEDENGENDEVQDVEEDEEENEASEASEVEAEVSSNNESDDDESMQTENGSKVSLGEESGADDDDDEEDEEMESDISEASSNSEQYGTGARGRNKQLAAGAKSLNGGVRNVKPARRRAVSSANSRSSKSTTTSNSNCGTRKARQRKVITKITTRSNGPAVMEDADTQRQTKGKRGKSAQSNKRGGSGRGGRGGRGAFAASAAGEVEQQALKQFLYDHHNQQQQQQQNFNGKRLRCTQKTDKGGGGGGNGGSSAFVHDDDSNSNLMLLNVWKRSNENIYARNAAAAAKSLTVGSRHDHMVTRHYRK